MNISNYNERGTFTKLIMILFIFFICFMLGGLITSILANLYNVPFNAGSLTSEMKREINFLKLFQFISALFTFILPPVIIAKFLNNNISQFLKLDNTPDFKYYIMIFIFMLASMPLMNMIINWNESIVFPDSLKGIEDWMRQKEDANKGITELMVSGTSWVDLFVNIFIIAIVPAIGEEFIFRGLIQKYLCKWFKNHHIAIILTAIIFSAIHFQFYGFIPRMLLGVFFGYLVYHTGSLWPAIFAHFANNGMAVIAYFLAGRNIINDEIENIGTQTSDIWYVIIGTSIAVFAGIYLFKKKRTVKSV